MRADLARADRAAAVRGAAQAWRQAGVIDAATLAVVEARHADDRVRLRPVFRVLLFAFTCFAIAAAHGCIAYPIATGGGGGQAALALAIGLALVAATDYQVGALRRRQAGTESATSAMALGELLGAAAWFLLSPAHLGASDALAALAVAAAALLGAAAWRWGYPLYAGAATAALLVAAAWLPQGRLVWIALPLLGVPLLLRAGESPRLPPAHRAAATAALVVALAALYVAVHLGSWEARLIEEIGGHSAPPRLDRGAAWWSAAVATALVPILLLGWGLFRCRRALLLVGAGTAAASLVTLRYYVHIAPLWLALILGGGLLLALALALERYLGSGAGGERHGFTAAPLFTDAARAGPVEVAAALLTLTPEARPQVAEPAFRGGGGRSGGGGATGEF